MTNEGVRLIATHVHHWDPSNAVRYPYPRSGPGAVYVHVSATNTLLVTTRGWADLGVTGTGAMRRNGRNDGA